MSEKRAEKPGGRQAMPEGPAEKPGGRQARRPDCDGEPLEDSAVRSLTTEERAQLSMDSWEPSLLRNLLRAQNKLRKQ